jgi:hypothetical protein
MYAYANFTRLRNRTSVFLALAESTFFGDARFNNMYCKRTNTQQFYLSYYMLHTFIWAILVVIVWSFDLQLPMQSVPITTKVVSSNPAHAGCTRYNILVVVMHYISTMCLLGSCEISVSNKGSTDGNLIYR